MEGALERVNPAVAKSYRDYRNYKLDFIHMMDDVYTKSQAIRYIGDKSNANTDSALVATKRSLIFNELNKELYRKFFIASFGSALIACIYGLVDMAMVGQYHGPDGSAAMAVIAPIWNIIYSFGL